MRAEQREAVLVLIDHLHGNLPALHRVAGIALRTELAFVDVGVTVSAFLADVGKYEPGMTLRAGHAGVHATKRVTCLIVIELRDLANRLP